MKSPEHIPGMEHIESKVLLHFMRHAEKAKSGDLTKEGREEAKNMASSESNLNQSIAFGSKRERTQHTVALRMSGAEEYVTGDESFNELQKKLDATLSQSERSTKVTIDPRLDFVFNEPYASAFDKEIRPADENGTTLEWLMHRSDALAREHNDVESSTYSRMAAGVASLILKYVQVSNTWDAVVQNKDKAYTPTLERFMGTSATLQECFLAKLIGIVKGEDEQRQFVAINNRGFGYTEGFDVEIIKLQSKEDAKVRVVYTHPDHAYTFDEIVSIKVISKIASEK